MCIFISLLALYKTTQFRQRSGALFGIFLCLVFSARFLIEFVKTKQAAYQTDAWLNTGQMLSIPFFLIGLALLANALRTKSKS
jgi:prolipoprotein diacylglyceryltransferase